MSNFRIFKLKIPENSVSVIPKNSIRIILFMSKPGSCYTTNIKSQNYV